MKQLASMLRAIADVAPAWRTSAALDQTSTKRTTPAIHPPRDQAVMHGLLRDRAQVPVHQLRVGLRSKIFAKLEEAQQEPTRRSSLPDALRVGAVPALVAVALALGVHVVSTQWSSVPLTKTTLAGAASSKAGGATAESPRPGQNAGQDAGHVAASDALHTRPVTAADLSSPITFPLTDEDARATTMSPLMREANAFQQTGPLIRDALLHRLPPLPDRPK